MSTYTTTVKSGRGIRHGVVSELSAFLTIKPGEADALRAGLGRFHARVRKAPWEVIAKIGIVDMKHVIFDDGTRLCWNTAFDTDWDPYIDDAVAILGADAWTDWLQHTVGYETEDLSTGAAIKRLRRLPLRATTSEKPMPHIPVPIRFMPSRPGTRKST